MKFRLLTQHFIAGQLMERGREVENVQATPNMVGLDDEGKAAVEYEMVRVFGRHDGVPHGFPTSTPLLDNPPIRRPLDDNQPIYHFVGTPEYSGSGGGGPPS
jgi:hypothetical protein